MLCKSCNKMPATTHIKTVINGQVVDYMLCSQCAKKLGESNILSNLFFDNSESFIKSFLGYEPKEDSKQNECDFCHTSFNHITDTGKLGCAHCYDVFYNSLMPTIKRIHGNCTEHKGKKSQYFKEHDCSTENVGKSEIPLLQEKLKKAVELQQFELAAQLRDRIKDIEKQVNDIE